MEHSDTKYLICNRCVIDQDIREYINTSGKNRKRCSVCKEKNRSISITDDNLVRMVRSLIRYHYPEYDYNGHWGGDYSTDGLLSIKNPIIDNSRYNSKRDLATFNEIIEGISGGIDSEHEVPLYAGHSDYGRELFPESLKSSGSELWNKVKEMIEDTNYDKIIKSTSCDFDSIFSESQHTLVKDSRLYRARIGFINVEIKNKVHDRVFNVKKAYKAPELSAPPPTIARSGRANREGISYIYLGSTVPTAIAEVRPHPGHFVSVGEFRIRKDLKLLNLHTLDLFNYSKSEEDLEKYVLRRVLADEFETPLTPDLNNRYLKTQLISDMANKWGFDGIVFRSSVSYGANYVLFDPLCANNIETSNKLYMVKKHDFTIGEVEYTKDYFMGTLNENIK